MAQPRCSSTEAPYTGVLSDKLGSIDYWRMYPINWGSAIIWLAVLFAS
jgi:hypothetical protein